jgi:hypothetical protein
LFILIVVVVDRHAEPVAGALGFRGEVGARLVEARFFQPILFAPLL